MQNKAVFYFHFDVFIFDNKVSGGKMQLDGNLPGARLLWNALPMQPVPFTTNVVGSNPAHVEVHFMQHYVIKFVGGLQQVCDFLRVFASPHQ